jgi:hypothetical protein
VTTQDWFALVTAIGTVGGAVAAAVAALAALRAARSSERTSADASEALAHALAPFAAADLSYNADDPSGTAGGKLWLTVALEHRAGAVDVEVALSFVNGKTHHLRVDYLGPGPAADAGRYAEVVAIVPPAPGLPPDEWPTTATLTYRDERRIKRYEQRYAVNSGSSTIGLLAPQSMFPITERTEIPA